MKLHAALISPLLAAGLSACALGPSSPVPDERNDVRQYVLIAPVPLSQAILVAEERTVGKAIRGELVRLDGEMAYRVLVTAQGRLHLVGVDPVSGKVTGITPAAATGGAR